MNFNKAIIAGRVTANPELRTTPGGQSVTTIGVATNRTWTDKNNQKQEAVEYHNVAIFGKRAEVVCQFIKKGQTLLIEGRLETRKWTDKDGHPRQATQIVAEDVQFGPSLAPKTSGQVEIEPEETIPADAIEEEEIQTEDIPF